MADNTFGSYHLADNPDTYEIQRSNNFEFVVTDLDNLIKPGAEGTETNAKFTNAQEVLRFSTVGVPFPSFDIQTVSIRRGNSVMNAAGLPSFSQGSFQINDYIGCNSKDILLAWQYLAYNPVTEKIGRMSEYKKDCYLLEYTPDYSKIVRTWIVKGAFVTKVDQDSFDQENGNKRTVTATIVYDKAYIDQSELE